MSETPTAVQPPPGTPTRLCPSCSALSETVGDFCPHCGASFVRRQRFSRRSRLILAAVLALVILAAGAGALTVKLHRDAQHRTAQRAAAAAVARQMAAEARRAAAKRAAAAAKRIETAQQIAARHASEREMETSITTWARKQVSSGLLNGPILRTSCTPIGGGSQNLAEITVKYDCLAVDKDNTDGTSDGYGVHATMDFSTGQYQWGLGNG
jgi:hypothetical protein